jgi:hypothetical protein
MYVYLIKFEDKICLVDIAIYDKWTIEFELYEEVDVLWEGEIDQINMKHYHTLMDLTI